MKKIAIAIAAVVGASSAQAGNIDFTALYFDGYTQDSPVAPDLFKGQGLLVGAGAVTACGGSCLTAPAYTYDGSLHGQFVVDGTSTQTSVSNLVFGVVLGNANFDLFDVSGDFVTSLNGGTGYSYNGPVGIGSFNASFHYDALYYLNFADAPAAGVPEPASWALMLGGFGMIGGAMRSRRTKAAVRFG